MANILDEAAALLRARIPDLMASYVFGSIARGDETAESDLDLAVLVDGPAPDALALYDLAQDIAGLAHRPVDLVELRAASTLLQHRIVTTGRRLWARDWRADDFELFVLAEKFILDERNAPLYADIEREGRVYGR